MRMRKTRDYIASLYDYQYGICVVLCEMTTGEMKAQLIDKSVICSAESAVTEQCAGNRGGAQL